uniref:A disintegrin and metalloproteinase with thrombospondin motifs 14-like n=1 Tax=Diabrotica virgifera virgifera TaxID=50390 RepID=A0A6P7GS57_DIAVI
MRVQSFLFGEKSIINVILVFVTFISFIENGELRVDLSNAEDVKSVFPKVYIKSVRRKRSLNIHEDVDIKVVKLGDWLAELDPQDNLVVAPGLRTEWFHSNETHVLQEPKKCDYHMGIIKGLEAPSKVAVSLCGALVRGYFDVGFAVYFVEPLDETTGEHVIYKSKSHIFKRSTASTMPPTPTPSQWVFNLTGDTFDIRDDHEPDQEDYDEDEDIELSTESIPEVQEMTMVEKNGSGYGEQSIEDLFASPIPGPIVVDEEENGYFFDTAWSSNLIEGLSHDGDEKNDNDCMDEAIDGSVMAPMVSATFNKFYWSSCSRREFKKYRNKWLCLLNPPLEGAGEISLNATLQASFTMDQQCRMEFGEGYTMCTAFEIIEPCTHLWCGHEKTPLVCKTKKGPPLEGTECGFVGIFSRASSGSDEVFKPVLAGPPNIASYGLHLMPECPSFGGKTCEGNAEEWRLCTVTGCAAEIFVDLRAQQCKHLPKIFNLAAENFTWLPYESDENAKKCKFNCLNGSKKEVFFTNENLMDGTPCSYENEDNICVQ